MDDLDRIGIDAVRAAAGTTAVVGERALSDGAVITDRGLARTRWRVHDGAMVPPVEFTATVVHARPATVAEDGFVGYLFGLSARADGTRGCLIIQRADDPLPEWQPYCLVWAEQEGTTYGGVCRVEVTDGEVTFELLRHNAAELGTPTRFRILFPASHTDEVRGGIRRTLGDSLLA